MNKLPEILSNGNGEKSKGQGECAINRINPPTTPQNPTAKGKGSSVAYVKLASGVAPQHHERLDSPLEKPRKNQTGSN